MSDKPAAKSVSVVVPIYNSAATLPELTDRLVEVLREAGAVHEIILVNDGSRDASWSTICRLAGSHRVVRGIDLARNFGQHNALLCGIRAARHAQIVTMDDDLQHPPEEIPVLLAALDADDVDVVYGVPMAESHRGWRVVASWITKLVLAEAMGAETARSISAFRAFRTKVADAFRHNSPPRPNIDVMLTWGAARFASERVHHADRPSGRSQYTLRKLIGHAITMLTGFSALPLRIASLLGFACTVFGVVVLAWVLGRLWLEGRQVPGFAFTASIVAIFSGAQLFTLGIMGEYLARIHFRSIERPSYVVRRSAFDS